LSEEIKKNESSEDGQKKTFSVNIPEDDFIDDIPAPEGEVPSDGKPHKVVRYVDSSPKAEKPAKEKKKKGGIVGEFFAGAAAGAKTVGEGISAGIKTVSEMKPKAEKSAKAEKPAKVEEPVKIAEPARAEEPVKVEEPTRVEEPVKVPEPKKAPKPVKTEEPEGDETQFPKDEKKAKAPASGIMAKLNSLPTGAVIGGAIGILVVLIAIILLIATSCSAGDEPSRPNNPGSDITISEGENGEPGSETNPEGEGDAPVIVPDRKANFVEAFNANNDVVGWLYVPGLNEVDAGVCFSYDKTYPYNKRDVKGNKVPNSYWIEGAYYSHYRNLFGDTAAELSTNTVIFGHSDLGKENLAYTNDDPNGPLFSQLFHFKDPSFAEKTPYIYLTLPGEETVWKVFAVFYNDAKATKNTFAPYYKSGAGDLWYIEPSPGLDEYELMLQTMQDRSIYDYNVEVGINDQILTLSTCTVAYGLQARDNYRFVIAAKLVYDDSETESNLADFTIRANAPIPETYRDEFDEYLSTWKPSAN